MRFNLGDRVEVSRSGYTVTTKGSYGIVEEVLGKSYIVKFEYISNPSYQEYNDPLHAKFMVTISATDLKLKPFTKLEKALK